MMATMLCVSVPERLSMLCVSVPARLSMLCVSVPARLSKISILNAIRSGTYVVNEPPPPPPADKDDDDDRADDGAKMTDNGMVANEDTTQVAMTRMPEENLPEQENLPELPSLPTKKPHSVHRSEHRNGVTFRFTVHCHFRKCLCLYVCCPNSQAGFGSTVPTPLVQILVSLALSCPPKSLAGMGLRSLVGYHLEEVPHCRRNTSEKFSGTFRISHAFVTGVAERLRRTDV